MSDQGDRLRAGLRELLDLAEDIDLTSPKESRSPVPTDDLAALDFDFDALRLMVNAKRARPGHGGQKRRMATTELATKIGVSDTTLGDFLRGDKREPTLRTAMRLLWWIGYTDLAEFVREDFDEATGDSGPVEAG